MGPKGNIYEDCAREHGWWQVDKQDYPKAYKVERTE